MLIARALDIRLGRPEDAPAIARCFDECYAGTYPLDEFTDPPRLAARLVEQRTVFAVALENEDVVAAVALEPAADGTGEFGHGVVKPTHRGQNLFVELHLPLLDLARSIGLSVVYSHCVTSHTRSQRSMPALDARVAGLSLSAAPRTLCFRGLREELSQRESFLDFAFVLAARPTAIVHVAPALEDAVALAYDGLGLGYRFARRRSDGMSLGFSERRNGELGTATLRFGPTGERSASSLRAALRQLELAGAQTLYAELPLGHPGAPDLTERLRTLGFSFAGVLPGRASGGSDALVLQRPRQLLSPSAIEIGLAEAETMKQAVFEDLAEVHPASATRQEVVSP